MKSVILNGPLLTQSGYGVHVRQCARWLLSRTDLDVKFVVTPWGDTPWVLDASAYGGLIGEIMKRTVAPDTRSDVSLQLKLPNEWTTEFSRVNVGITAAVETDRCNPTWIDYCNKMDMIIVPSSHAKNSLTNTGNVTRPLKVIPEAYSDAIISKNELTIPDFSTSFNFLVFGQLTGNNPFNDRKNIFHTIKWLSEAFKDDPDVGIVVKTNIGRNSLIDRSNVKSILASILGEVRKDGKGPKVHLLHGDMSDEEVAALYKHRQIKSLVTLTRGEGYGLPILEAAASGLPIIATGWSGHLDFLNLGKYVSVFYQLGEVHQTRIDDKIFMKGARWANASEEDFKRRVVKFHDSYSTPKSWAVELQQKIVKSYSFEEISKAYNATLSEIV